MTAIALSIAGTDPTSGAGIQADLKTFSALGVYGATVITALVAQNTCGVTAIHDVPADFVAAEIDAVFSDLAVGATKIGMLSKPEVIETVAEGLTRWEPGPVVLDPVMVAASGDPLIADEAVTSLRERLFPLSAVITPNLMEAARLLDVELAQDSEAMLRQAKALADFGAGAVLLKGGHGNGDEAADLLWFEGEAHWFSAPRIDTKNTHGTGCTLSSAIAAGLANGLALPEAVDAAKAYVHNAIVNADLLEVGKGHGPVHHFYRQWRNG
ncbi:bifunctional hydroxymethylpyrimidine kinase/phosphomethylpyrimidine kinase [Afifella marina]|uniref:hydroxymethylpyrimidine kinase n=1 Tax=Afifella marina DSM 2698 TaxID=1120955 RepID=A0A1G5N5P2_AFIMA|nr:bifunctional hydroxymethylpyrimidine kinase/phosphomethylpyrimidine kinase [Afifella marina]MBK1622517.1 bifunctional hydroxymethylpyrimidine kinase/phosphomethylpyrimidine kinase [Afifella marina DSM 2698]MBK1626768.1 bifunctional hydroxymethylpyrimidine kinase/phosphomethylpyrimidine kinase [Afifella marina]MBK5919302.1 bifunctional hydroxymethylpyrimidine kinase/phosphomethylpyrimidine kinase [Afifella marina]RAI21337.1 bifunctional hydroxymethylpyrimidine kinase/phosphomethylpyrimidine k